MLELLKYQIQDGWVFLVCMSGCCSVLFQSLPHQMWLWADKWRCSLDQCVSNQCWVKVTAVLEIPAKLNVQKFSITHETLLQSCPCLKCLELIEKLYNATIFIFHWKGSKKISENFESSFRRMSSFEVIFDDEADVSDKNDDNSNFLPDKKVW